MNMAELPARRWITCLEAADLYGWHVKTVYKLVAQRRLAFTRLPGVREGSRGDIRIDRRALDEMLETRAVQPIAPAPLDRRRRR